MFDTDSRRAYAAGREEQYMEMMRALGALESKYKGVRGELLKKVRSELLQLKPPTSGLSLVARPAQAESPRCRACGRELKLNGTDGQLMCMNGHRG